MAVYLCRPIPSSTLQNQVITKSRPFSRHTISCSSLSPSTKVRLQLLSLHSHSSSFSFLSLMASALFGCAVQERLHQRDDSPDRRRRRHRRIRRRRFAGGPCSLLRRRLPHFSPQRSEKFRVFLGFFCSGFVFYKQLILG